MTASIRQRLSAHWGWAVVAASWLLFFVIYGITYSYGIFFVELQEEFGSSASLTGWVGTFPVGLSVLVAPLAHILTERFDYRLVGLVSLAVSSVGVIATSFVPSLAVMFATYSIMYGVGTGILFVVAMKLVLSYFPNKNSSRASGIALSGCSIAMVSFAPLVSHLISKFGWRMTLRIISTVYTVVGVACVAMFTPPTNHKKIDSNPKSRNIDESERPSELEETSAKESQKYQNSGEHDGNDFQPHESRVESTFLDKKDMSRVERYPKRKQREDEFDGVPLARLLLKAFTYPEMLIISVATLVNGVADGFYYINMVSYMVSVGFSEADGALFISVIGASTICGKIAFAVIVEYLPFPSYFVAVIAPLIGCAVMVGFMVVHSIAVLLFLAAVIGSVLLTSSSILAYTIPMQLFAPSRARFTTPVYLCSNGIGLLMGSLVGQSIDRTGSYTSAIWAFIAMYVVIALLFIAAPLYQRRYAPHRYVLMDIHRLKRATQSQHDHEAQILKSTEINLDGKDCQEANDQAYIIETSL